MTAWTSSTGSTGRLQVSDRSTGLMIAVVAVISLAPVSGAGQTLPPGRDAVAPRAPAATTAAAGPWNPPRTPDGQPDIQGTWNQRDNITTYSLQAGAEDRAVHIGITGQAAATGQPIKDPPNKIPYLPWAEEKARFLYDEHRRPTSPEDLDPVSRGFLEGVPRINLQGGFQILQSPGQVVLVHEYRPHVSRHPTRRPSASRPTHETLDGRFTRALGGKYARRRRHQQQRPDLVRHRREFPQRRPAHG